MDSSALEGRAASARRRVLLLGATGSIGRATATALVRRGFDVVAFARPRETRDVRAPARLDARALPGVEWREGSVLEVESVWRDGFRGEPFDAVVSCMASRTGVPRDAWAIDHQAHCNVLEAAVRAGASHFVLLSAICVQRPRLAFQQAKLAFEKVLIDSGMNYSIVRPTAFFKSLSGQVERVRQGRPFLVFGDGTLTACKPISDRDLGNFLATCLDDETRHRRILPIGGPGEAITPRDQAEHLFALLDRTPRIRRVPVGFLDFIAAVLGILGRLIPSLAEKAELAKIGRYYATESMLCLNPETGRYDSRATPSWGQDRLFDHYAELVRGDATTERGEHSVF